MSLKVIDLMEALGDYDGDAEVDVIGPGMYATKSVHEGNNGTVIIEVESY